jgi:hypothetical protein
MLAPSDRQELVQERNYCPFPGLEGIWGGGIEIQLYSFITSSLVGDEWSTSCPGHFTPGEKTAVGPRASLDFREKTFQNICMNILFRTTD